MKQLAVLIAALVLAPSAFAAIDITPVTTEINTYPALIATVGGAVLIVGLAVAGIKWVRSAFGR